MIETVKCPNCNSDKAIQSGEIALGDGEHITKCMCPICGHYFSMSETVVPDTIKERMDDLMYKLDPNCEHPRNHTDDNMLTLTQIVGDAIKNLSERIDRINDEIGILKVGL